MKAVEVNVLESQSIGLVSLSINIITLKHYLNHDKKSALSK